MKLKKLLFLLTGAFLSLTSLSSCFLVNTLVVYTEAGFAPFEYVSHRRIVGVDVDIMTKVAEKMGKKVMFENVAFDTIIDTVSAGKLTYVGAAGLSITEERKAKVNFSTEYYQANLYVIYNVNNVSNDFSKIMTDSCEGVYWSSLNSKKGVGVQSGTTADLFLADEIAEGGSLEGIRPSFYSNLDTAIADIGLNVDFLIIDELPAKKLVENKPNLNCLPLYYEGEEDERAYDSYAIAVTKGQDEILNTINEVLNELLNDVDENGLNGIQQLVNYHLGI